jgi:hypothetical protein
MNVTAHIAIVHAIPVDPMLADYIKEQGLIQRIVIQPVGE